MPHSILRDKLIALEAPVELELTLAVFPNIEIHRIINSHCEEDGFPRFLLEREGPTSELSAQKWPSPPRLTGLRESLCGRREPRSLLLSHRWAAARMSTGRRRNMLHRELFYLRLQYSLNLWLMDSFFIFILPHMQESYWRSTEGEQGWADGRRGLCVAVRVWRWRRKELHWPCAVAHWKRRHHNFSM